MWRGSQPYRQLLVLVSTYLMTRRWFMSSTYKQINFGRLVAPIYGKFCADKGHVGPIGRPKFHFNRSISVGTRPQKYQKFPLFGKISLRRGETLDRFPKILVSLMRPTISHKCFKFDTAGYGVIAEIPRIGHLGLLRNFQYTLWEKLCVGSKYDYHIIEWSQMSFISMQSLMKIEVRAPAVGAKISCLHVCFFLFVTLRGRRALCSRGT